MCLLTLMDSYHVEYILTRVQSPAKTLQVGVRSSNNMCFKWPIATCRVHFKNTLSVLSGILLWKNGHLFETSVISHDFSCMACRIIYVV